MQFSNGLVQTFLWDVQCSLQITLALQIILFSVTRHMAQPERIYFIPTWNLNDEESTMVYTHGRLSDVWLIRHSKHMLNMYYCFGAINWGIHQYIVILIQQVKIQLIIHDMGVEDRSCLIHFACIRVAPLHQSRGSNSNAGKMDQLNDGDYHTWATLTGYNSVCSDDEEVPMFASPIRSEKWADRLSLNILSVCCFVRDWSNLVYPGSFQLVNSQAGW